MIRISPRRFHFQVYKNFVPPPSALEFVESYFKKNFASYGHKTKIMTSEFLADEIKISKSDKGLFRESSASIPLYTSNCGGVNIHARKCSKLILQNSNNKNENDVDGEAESKMDNDAEDDGDLFSRNHETNPCLPRNDTTFSPISRTAEGFSIFETHLNQVSNFQEKLNQKQQQQQKISSSSSARSTSRVVPPFSVFEGNAKDQWIDNNIGWCHLCQEPTGVSSNHIGDRDHACMSYYLYLYTLYPRTWSTRAMVLDSLKKFPSVAFNSVATPFSCEHLHTLDDCQRRLELESILVHLSNPNSPNQVLASVLQGSAPIALWVAGERIFKPNISQLIAEMCPPMGAGIQTAVTQKCWSRTNLERMYDALNIAKIQKSFDAEPKTGRLEKAFFMRTLFFELHSALDETRGDEKKSPKVVLDDENDTVNDDEIDECGYDYFDATKRLLVQECLRRMAFELVFLQTMIYMNRIQYVARTLKTPSWPELNAWDSL